MKHKFTVNKKNHNLAETANLWFKSQAILAIIHVSLCNTLIIFVVHYFLNSKLNKTVVYYFIMWEQRQIIVLIQFLSLVCLK